MVVAVEAAGAPWDLSVMNIRYCDNSAHVLIANEM